jgi:hypothetical protein
MGNDIILVAATTVGAVDPAAVAQHAIDLTAILVAAIAGFFGVVKLLAAWWLERRVKDATMRELLEKALDNGLGVIQQAASGEAVRIDPQLRGVVPDKLLPGVQYVIDHAGEALSHFRITPELVAEKLIARWGKKEIETNIAVTANAATPAIVPPLAPSPEGTTAAQLNRDELARIAMGAPA